MFGSNIGGVVYFILDKAARAPKGEWMVIVLCVRRTMHEKGPYKVWTVKGDNVMNLGIYIIHFLHS